MNSPLKTYFWQLNKTAISMIAIVAYSRLLGASGRGELSVNLLYLQMGLMFTELFSGSAMANWFTKFAMNKLLFWLILIPVIFLTVGSVLGLYLGFQNSILLLCQGIGLVLINIQLNYFQSKGFIQKRNVLQLVQEGVKLGLVLGFAQFAAHNHADFKVSNILWVFAISTWITVGFSLLQNPRLCMDWWPIQKPPISIFFEGIWAQLGHVILFLLFRAPIWVISKYVSLKGAGVFANVLLIADTSWIFAGSFGTIIHSRVIRSSASSFHHRLLRHYMSYSFFGTLIISIVLVCIPASVYQTVFGAEFIQMKPLSMFIIPAILCVSLTSNLGNYLHAMNRFKTLFVNHCIGLITMVSLMIVGLKYGQLSDYWMVGCMDFGFLMILILHLNSVNWKFSEWRIFGYNLLIIKRFIQIRF